MAEGAMASAVAPARAEMSAGSPAEDKPKRLLSLDVFRGATIIAMILVNNARGPEVLVPLRHAAWHGITPTDLIFPFFLFIMGVSMAFSFGRRLREQPLGRIYGRVIFRTLALVAIGLFLYNYRKIVWSDAGLPVDYPFWQTRWFGVLNRIGICYFFAAVAIIHWGRPRPIVATIAALLVGYWALMVLAPFEGRGEDPWARDNNYTQYFEARVMGPFMERRSIEPEGIISTLPAIANVLIGFLGGLALRRREATMEQKTITLFLWGGALVLLSMFWAGEWGPPSRQLHLFMPINKMIWTSTYALLTCGLGLIALASCYWLIDARGWRRGTGFCVVFGANAILAYVGADLTNRIPSAHRWVTLEDGRSISFTGWLHEHLLQPALGPWLSGYVWPLLIIALWWAILRSLYRRKIFLRL